MSQAQPPPGLADLEKELGCSICTELLYQPLTLLDCLHTFCGSCLKEWFTAQGSRRRSSSDTSRFTCPSCRAEVLRTKTNATVTTLLEMVLAAHPDRARSATEKEEIAERYSPGESVFPPLPPPQEDDESEEDENDRRVLREVQELSLRESRAQARRETRRAANSERTRDRSSNPERSTEDGRSRRRRDEDSERQQSSTRTRDDADRARRVEHQSSLRSLLSLSSEAETMQEEILRQILEEGLLDDIDFDNLSATQEEELSERIADAYRRRHMQQPRAQGHRRRQSPNDSSRTHSRSQSAQRSSETTPPQSTRDTTDRRPPATRPHLFDPPTPRPTPNHQRRNSEQADGRRRTSPARVNQASNSEDTLRPAARSSSDMTAERTRGSQNARTRAESSSNRPRRATESDQGISEAWMGAGRERGSSRVIANQPVMSSPTSDSSPQPNPPQNSTPTDQSAPVLSSPVVPPRSARRPSSSRWSTIAPSTAQYREPSISCDRCGMTNIQYDVHKKCSKCKDPDYHLCLRCYRTDGDYPHGDSSRTNGYAPAAQAIYEQILASPNHRPAKMRQTGHILRSFKYERPSDNAQVIASGERKITNDNPARRLISGLFCDICQSPANECFWKCSQCNEGDWGFCNRCVNQGRCCTHPLLPIRRITGGPKISATSTPADANALSRSNSESFKTLAFSTNCDICTYPIPASVTRFHCLKCNDGDYDVCTNCYLKLVATSKISKENGHNGWRRCLASHRMIIVGFEDRDDGQRRAIVRDLVGGNALQDEHIGQSPTSSPVLSSPASPDRGNGYWSWKEGSERRKKASRLRGSISSPTGNNPSASSSDLGHSSGTPTSQHGGPFRRFPPDGGVGLVVRAKWSYFPGDEDEDELVFPRGAEIKEVDDVNDEWYWGSYAGRTGLFPGTHVTVLAEIR